MSERKKRSGGPQTIEGKARSSQNSRTHGVRSTALILPDEDQQDYDALADGWRRQFEPEGYQEERLVEALIRSDWFFQRAERRWMETEMRLVEKNANPLDWTAEERHQLELLHRYKTAAERSFQRAWQMVRGLQVEYRREQDKVLKLWMKSQDLRQRAGLPVEHPEISEPETGRTESSKRSEGWVVRTISFPVMQTGFVPSREPMLGDLDREPVTET